MVQRWCKSSLILGKVLFDFFTLGLSFSSLSLVFVKILQEKKLVANAQPLSSNSHDLLEMLCLYSSRFDIKKKKTFVLFTSVENLTLLSMFLHSIMFIELMKILHD